MRVFAYYNLHKHVWSLKSLQKDFHYGRVVIHADAVLLGNCLFKVSNAGRRRVLETGRKQVHAGVVGTIKGLSAPSFPSFVGGGDLKELGSRAAGEWSVCELPDNYTARATYNPFRWKSFVWFRGEEAVPLFSAEAVYMADRSGRGRTLRPLPAPLYVKGANAPGAGAELPQVA